MEEQLSEEHTPQHGDMFSANFPMDHEGRTLHLQWRAGEIASRLILVGSTGRARLFATEALEPDTMRQYNSSRGFLAFTGFPKRFPDLKVSIIAVGMGFPMMDFVIREVRAIVEGPLVMVRVGTSGTPQQLVNPGTFVQCWPGSYFCRRNPDAWADERAAPYLMSKLIRSDEALSHHIFDACTSDEAISSSYSIVQGANCSADSYYSSQGRLDMNFCDRNVDLMEWISSHNEQGVSSVEMETFQLLDLARCVDSSSPIYASAISLVLANRG